ncbi:EpsG family protein [Priestia sp. GS2]|uniref:EpsG family protein n=1 Tax=Priestia sp. GS2 TaxID=3117403 RepID=UPI002EDAE6C4
MAVYVFLLFLISIFYLIRKSLPVKFQNVIILVLFLLISFIEGFRYKVGTDTAMYETIYNNSLHTVYSDEFVEIGYLYLNKFFVMMGLSFQLFLLATSFFINYNYIKGFIKLKVDTIALVFFYVTSGIYFSTFNTLRQAIATSIIVFSLNLVLEKKYFRFTLLVFVSFFFHRSVFVALLIMLLIRVTIKPVTFVYLVATIFIIFNLPIIDDLILGIFKFLPVKYSMYMEEIFSDEGVKLVNLILPTIVLIAVVLNYKKLLNINENNRFFINLFFIFYLCLIISTKFLLFYRISSYFEIGLILILPSIILLFNIKDRPIVDVFLVIVFVIYIIGKILMGHYGVFPYESNFKL